MQDTQTGEFVPITDVTPEAMDAALPRERQGAVFCMGEEVELKGGRFAVQSIGKTFITLRGLPGTDISTKTPEELMRKLQELESRQTAPTTFAPPPDPMR